MENPRLVGVVSDTHDNIGAVDEAVKLFRGEGVDLVIHAGDIVAPFTLKRLCDGLGGIPVYAVFGNNCGEKTGLSRVASSVCGTPIRDPPMELIVAGRRILVLHGYGGKEMTVGLVDSLARGGDWDVIVYGHTHEARVDVVGGTLVVNPGEACGCLTGRRSAAILDLDSLTARIVGLG